MCRSWVYPRECGATFRRNINRTSLYGLSPRVRGNPLPDRRRSRRTRSIPASAGQPFCLNSATLGLCGQVYPRECGATSDRHRGSAGPPNRVYPRECGATEGWHLSGGGQGGLSPRVRGNHPDHHRRDLPGGSIPASAGQPRDVASHRLSCAVYPRECGATSAPSGLSAPCYGLSPRVRGNHGKRPALGGH